MSFFLSEYAYLLPEMTLLICGCVVLLVDLFAHQKCSQRIFYLTLITFLLTSIALSTLNEHVDYSSSVFDNLISFTELNYFIKHFLLLLALLSTFYLHTYLLHLRIDRAEIYVLHIFLVLSLFCVSASTHFLSFYIALELSTIITYTQIGLNFKKPVALEAAIKYFLLGAIASAVGLYGISLIYGMSQQLVIDPLYFLTLTHSDANWHVYALGAFMLLAMFLFKFGVFPFHQWLVDVYTGGSAPIVAVLASLPKVAIFIVLYKFLLIMFATGIGYQTFWVLTILSLIAILLGSFAALTQPNIRRIFAYSALSHSGLAIISLVISLYFDWTIYPSMFYILVYAYTSCAIFGLFSIVMVDGRPLETLDDLRGFARQMPGLSFAFMCLVLSLAGIPPFAGFLAKVEVFMLAIQAELYPVVFVMLLGSLIAAYYYLKILSVIYFESNDQQSQHSFQFVGSTLTKSVWYLHAYGTLALTACSSYFTDYLSIIVS